jgi:hypothetical protein
VGKEAFDRLKAELVHAFATPESSYEPLTATQVIARNRIRRMAASASRRRHPTFSTKSAATLATTGEPNKRIAKSPVCSKRSARSNPRSGIETRFRRFWLAVRRLGQPRVSLWGISVWNSAEQMPRPRPHGVDAGDLLFVD